MIIGVDSDHRMFRQSCPCSTSKAKAEPKAEAKAKAKAEAKAKAAANKSALDATRGWKKGKGT